MGSKMKEAQNRKQTKLLNEFFMAFIKLTPIEGAGVLHLLKIDYMSEEISGEELMEIVREAFLKLTTKKKKELVKAVRDAAGGQ